MGGRPDPAGEVPFHKGRPGLTDIPEFIEAILETVASSSLVEETEFDVEPPVLRVILVLKV